MKTSQEVAVTIKQLASDQGVLVKDLLSECGLSKNALSSMQTGGYLPRVENLCKIADYLNVSVDYLLGRETKSAPDDSVRSEIIARVKQMSDDQAMQLLAFLESILPE